MNKLVLNFKSKDSKKIEINSIEELKKYKNLFFESQKQLQVIKNMIN